MAIKIEIEKYIGKKYNKLTIISFSHFSFYKYRHKNWLCRCDCGGEKVIIHGNLISGKSTSCGCVQKQKMQEFNKNKFRAPVGTSTFHNLFLCYKKRAMKINKEFSLTKDEFKIITKQNCFYCCEVPKNVHKISSYDEVWQDLNKYVYNGIDRVDSSKGYVLYNCVPCCKRCNQIKNNMKQDEFFKHVETIYLQWKLKQMGKEIVVEKLK